MIGRNETFRRASSHDNLFSLQEAAEGTDSSLILNSNEKLHHLPDHRMTHDLPSLENRARYPSSNSIQAIRTRELSSYSNSSISSKRASTDLTSIWGPIESMGISSGNQSSRTRTNSHETFSAPHFSDTFLLDDNLMPRLMTQNAFSSQKQMLTHNSSSTIFDPSSFDPAQKTNINSSSTTFQGSNWANQTRTAFINPPPAPLKKSASMASLPFTEQYGDSGSFLSNSTTPTNGLSDGRSLDFAFRSAISAPHSREPTVSSDYLPTPHQTGPICRYFLQGYCSRGSRCFYSHNTKVTFPHQHQPLQPSVPSITVNHQPYPPSSLHHFSSFSPVLLNATTSPSPVISSHSSFEQQQQQQSQQQQQDSTFYSPVLSGPGFDSRHSSTKVSSSNTSSFIKKPALEEETSRYSNMSIENLHGQYYEMCKDQFGCRYLQKQIEENPEKAISCIFQDIFNHLTELMTDPFGNYLCQKLLEFCNENQKGMIVTKVAPTLVAISLNMHGTRAVQKLIENVSNGNQIKMITDALAVEAVKLIKDLNGNHVIQKCLSKLSFPMNQFVFDAVSATIVDVATHRHGCCVLQRCIDHAVDSQKLQLVKEIALNGLALVQDPFGNYVVQYVLDLEDECYSSYIVHPFIGNVCSLSVQKFSSNVIEKCIRVSNNKLRRKLIEELLDRTKLENLLKDSYANYVVQTALDYADPEQKQKLIECIKPMLPVIRTTPYGKRIQSKLLAESNS